MPFLKPKIPLGKITTRSTSKKKKSIPPEESKYLGKPLLYGTAAIKSLRINQNLAVATSRGSERPESRQIQTISKIQTTNDDDNVEDVDEAVESRNLEMLMNFYNNHKSTESIDEDPEQHQNYIQQSKASLSLFPSVKPNTSSKKGASSSKKKNVSKQKRHLKREPEEPFDDFKDRVFNRPTTELGTELNQNIQDAMLKLSLGKSLFEQDKMKGIVGNPMIPPGRKVQFDTRVRAKHFDKDARTENEDSTTVGQSTDDDDLMEYTFTGDENLAYLTDHSNEPYQVTFGGGQEEVRKIDDDNEAFMKSFHQKNTELKKFIRQTTKEFNRHRGSVQNQRMKGFTNPKTIGDSRGGGAGRNSKYLIKNPILPFGFEKDAERIMNNRRNNTNTTRTATTTADDDEVPHKLDFRFNYDDVLKFPKVKLQSKNPRLDKLDDDKHSVRILRHAEKLLEESAKLKPDENFVKKLEAGQEIMKQEKMKFYGIHKKPEEQPLGTIKNTKGEEVLDLDYEPLKGVEKHGPKKLFEILKAKRQEVLQKGYSYQNDDDINDDDDDSLGEGWAQVLRMNSSILDEAFDMSPTNTSAGSIVPPKAKVSSSKVSPKAKVSSSKVKVTNKNKDKVDIKKHQEQGGYDFEEGKDYFFKTHPPFMKMVENLGGKKHDDDHHEAVKLPPIDNVKPKKAEIKTRTTPKSSMADIIFKPKRRDLLSYTESKTPSGLLDLDAKTNKKVQQQGRRDTHAYNRFGDPTTNLVSHLTPKEQKRLLKEAKDEHVRQYVQQQHQQQDIQLFSSGVDGVWESDNQDQDDEPSFSAGKSHGMKAKY